MKEDGGLLSQDQPPQKLLPQIASVFVPDFLSRRRTVTKRLGPTAWLDGLRGIAALLVCCSHLTFYTHDGIELCYNAEIPFTNGKINGTLAAFPILRLPFSGAHFAVMLFFVISGYVVPRRLLQHLHNGERSEFLESLQSAMIRRPVRLWVPIILSTFIVFIHWHLFGIKSPTFPEKENIFLEAYSWVLDILHFMFFFKMGWLFTWYNAHTWTIPVELRGSMFLFTFLMMVHSVRTRNRILLTCVMIIHLSIFSTGAWYATFFGGMYLCDMQLLGESGRDVPLPWDRLVKSIRQNKALRQILLHVLFFFSLYLASQPVKDTGTRAEILGTCNGWKTLGWLIPSAYWDNDAAYRWFWFFWAGFGLVYSIGEIGWLRAACESPIAQYLGRHSFALYLVHGPMISSFSQPLIYRAGVKTVWSDEQKLIFGPVQDLWKNTAWWPFPSMEVGPFGLEPAFLFCVAVSLPFYLYLAEVGTRLFDDPSVKVARWFWLKWKTL